MRVGLIIFGSINTITGGYIYNNKLVKYLSSKGVTVKIFSQKKKIWAIVNNNFSKKLINEVIEFSPDLLLEDEMNFASLFLFNKKIKRILNIPIISIIHLFQFSLQHNIFIRFFTKKIESLYLNTVNGYIFNSLSTQKNLKDLIGAKNNSLVAYPGKDRLHTSIPNNKEKYKAKKLKIIFIGNLSHNKGLHLLLRALSEIEFNFWHLSIVGDLNFDLTYTKKILKLITNLKISENIKIHGLLNIENLKKELVLHHILIVPSYFESYGMVYTEAMGAGIPVIASNVGGIPEIVNDKINGFLITPGDYQMLKKYIIKVLKNRQLLQKMSYASLSAYQKFPFWDETMAKVYTFLRQNIQK